MAEDRQPNSTTGTTVVIYDDEDSPEGEVIWDGEAEGLGLPHAKTMPRVVSVDPAPDDDAEEADAGAGEAAQPPED